tara:strand:+ start:170 stop:874 length:705 start_codon:yes stop_codon:yes gene_type:complete
LKIIIIFTLFCNLLLYFKKISSEQNPEHTQVWLHRGQAISSNIFNIFAFTEKHSWEGVELDIYFNKDDNIFYIAHDDSIESMDKFSKLDDLNQVEGKKLWLDLKNLKDVNLLNVFRLKNQLEELGETNFIFIESQNFIKLKILQNDRVKSIFQPPIVSENKFFLLILKYFTNFFEYDYVSVPYKQLSIINDLFKKGRIVTFTVNSPELLCKLIKDNYTKVILSSIEPDKNKCKN